MSETAASEPRLDSHFLIRPEAPADTVAIRQINELAFARREEADIVDTLREAGAVTLSMVATPSDQPEEPIGHVLYSPLVITGDGVEHSALCLGPLAVLPEHQQRGAGTCLVEASLESLRASGYPAVILLGHPLYYPRFGFVPAEKWGLKVTFEYPEGAFMALELQPGALAGVSGTIRFRPEFGV